MKYLFKEAPNADLQANFIKKRNAKKRKTFNKGRPSTDLLKF